ncbi:hypothetical protein BDZ89DRAFT_1056878 [Hymenopellis radicata]|nr:hypothetical protein BDZ89DRAFT_1056878 [Hymenopellis radicata]
MSRRLLRLPFLRTFIPRVSAPVLPITRQSALTNTPRATHSRLFSNFPARLSPPTSPRSASPLASDSLPPNASFTQKAKHLFKAYGGYAIGVYFILGVLDFGVAFVAINLIGAEPVSQFASYAKDAVLGLVMAPHPTEPGREEMDSTVNAATGGGHDGLYAMIILAYTVHKTLFMPLRVGLTAAFTPRLVRWLRTKGWAGGAGTLRAAEEMRDKLRRRSTDRS